MLCFNCFSAVWHLGQIFLIINFTFSFSIDYSVAIASAFSWPIPKKGRFHREVRPNLQLHTHFKIMIDCRQAHFAGLLSCGYCIASAACTKGHSLRNNSHSGLLLEKTASLKVRGDFHGEAADYEKHFLVFFEIGGEFSTYFSTCFNFLNQE